MAAPGDQVQARVELLARVGLLLRDVDAKSIAKLLHKCPDVELAAAAVQMLPRPAWVEELIGPAPDLFDQASSASAAP